MQSKAGLRYAPPARLTTNSAPGLIGTNSPVEFDHRGIRLPARTRVGGIIIPQ